MRKCLQLPKYSIVVGAMDLTSDGGDPEKKPLLESGQSTYSGVSRRIISSGVQNETSLADSDVDFSQFGKQLNFVCHWLWCIHW